MASLESVLEQALALNDDDRGKLIAQLIDSLGPADGDEVTGEEWDASWSEELARRSQDVRDGKVELVDADEVMRELREMSKRT